MNRLLNTPEILIATFICEHTGWKVQPPLARQAVVEINDEMGSVKSALIGPGSKIRVGASLFLDNDGVPVVSDLFLWGDASFAELAHWRADGQKILSYPVSRHELSIWPDR